MMKSIWINKLILHLINDINKLLISLLLIATPAFAEPLLVLPWINDTRIVLSKQSCIVPQLKGNRAVIQKLEPNGKVSYIRGCWTTDPHNAENIKIDWEKNQYSENDFAVIEMSKFTFVEN